jgi:protein required for attachment to host cells
MQPDTWIVVADGARARIFSRRRSRTPSLALSLEYDFSTASLPRRPLQLSTDVCRELELAQARGLARVVLVAPQAALADLREACSADVRALVTDEFDENLTRMSYHEIAAYLQDVLR